MAQLDDVSKPFTLANFKADEAPVLLDRMLQDIYDKLQIIIDELNDQSTRLDDGGL